MILLKRERGSAAIEFAIVLPMLLTIMSLIIDYGWYFTNWIILTDAVTAGARAAVKAKEWEGEDPSTIAQQTVKANFWDKNIKVNAEQKMDQSNRKWIEVKASLNYKPLMGFLLKNLLPNQLYAKVVMVFP